MNPEKKKSGGIYVLMYSVIFHLMFCPSKSTYPSLESFWPQPYTLNLVSSAWLYTSRDLYTASCALCCGVCWLLYTACGSFHKYLWLLWCYSQGLQSVRRLYHNTCVPRPAVRGLVGLRESKNLQQWPRYTFLWPFHFPKILMFWK